MLRYIDNRRAEARREDIPEQREFAAIAKPKPMESKYNKKHFDPQT